MCSGVFRCVQRATKVTGEGPGVVGDTWIPGPGMCCSRYTTHGYLEENILNIKHKRL